MATQGFKWGCGSLILVIFLGSIVIGLLQEKDTPPVKKANHSDPIPPKAPFKSANHLKEAETLLKAWSLAGVGGGKDSSVEQFADNIIFADNLIKLRKIADHLNAIEKGHADYSKAQKVKRELRKKCASEFEKMFLEAGIDAYIRTSGSNNDSLKLKHISFGRPFAYQMRNSLFIETMQYIGFKRVTFDNGFNNWTYNSSEK